MKKVFTALCSFAIIVSFISPTIQASEPADKVEALNSITIPSAQNDTTDLSPTDVPTPSTEQNPEDAIALPDSMVEVPELSAVEERVVEQPQVTEPVEDFATTQQETKAEASQPTEPETETVIEPTVENYFTDVTKNDYYYHSLQYAIKQNYIAYDEKRLFNASKTATRMDIVHMLIQVKGLQVNSQQKLPTFKDVAATDPNMPYIAAVVNAGYMSGDNKNNFNPNKTLTRAELAATLTRTFALKPKSANNFHDVYENTWYEKAILALLTNGISNGSDKYLFKPESTLTRGEMVVFFVRAGEPSFRLKPITIPAASCARPTDKTTYRVDVAVMNMWKHYNNARSVDQPSMTDPVDYTKWINSMSLSQKKWLVDRTDTQALYNDEVKILEQRGNMYRVAAVDQWVPYNSSGYPGWVPKSQVSGTKLDTSECQIAIIKSTKAPLLHTDTSHYMTLGYSTILSVIRTYKNWVIVQTPDAGEKAIDRKHVKIFDSYEDVTKPTRADIVNEAKRFMNLPYLWAGTSSWGYDCSGIIYAVYRNFGIMIPRDSFYQAIKGKPVAKKNLQPGDLIFFAYNGGKGKVYHVGIYVSPGKMLHAPHYASKVKIESFEQGAYARNYAGARSYLD